MKLTHKQENGVILNLEYHATVMVEFDIKIHVELNLDTNLYDYKQYVFYKGKLTNFELQGIEEEIKKAVGEHRCQ